MLNNSKEMEAINISSEKILNESQFQNELSFKVEPILLSDKFLFSDISHHIQHYTSLSQVKQDLSKIVRKNKYFDSFFLKTPELGYTVMKELKYTKIKQLFDVKIVICGYEMHLYDLLKDEEFLKAITVEDQATNLNNNDYIHLIQQWKYPETLDEYENYIKSFIEHTQQCLCNGNSVIFNWNGLNTKVLILSELYARGKINMNKYKQIICEPNQSGTIVKRYGGLPNDKNYSNFIFFNESAKVKYIGDDNFYFVVNVKPIKFSDSVLAYYDRLTDETKVDGFYESLMTYFMTRDLTGFDPAILPSGNEHRTLTR
ncbi:hypothetical protein QTN25_000759 [Entamoeba marina]